VKGFVELHKLGYLISNLYQPALGSWYVTFRSPYEWEYFYASGTNLAECMDNAAKLAHERGPALIASKSYKVAKAEQYRKLKRRRSRVRLSGNGRQRVR